MADIETHQSMQEEMQRAWRRYLDLVEPVRPGLYAYCRRMTRNVWDAEDLVQDTLIRGFGRMGTIHQDITNPSTYLLRIASNLWIDRVRRKNAERAVLDRLDMPEKVNSDTTGALQDGGRILMQHLAPQERAAIVLKEVFEYSAKEIARILETEGRSGTCKLSAFRPIVSARRLDLLGDPLDDLKVDDGSVAIEITGHGWVEVEARWQT